MVKVPRPGGFLGGLKVFFPPFFCFFLGLRLSVARHEWESGGDHVKCDTFGFGLAHVGDEILIRPDDLSRLLAHKLPVLRCLLGICNTCSSWLSFGHVLRTYSNDFGLDQAGSHLLVCG
jgi:hypothetical protein